MKKLIKNGRVMDPYNGMDCKTNILIEDDKIRDLTREEISADLVIDAEGLIVSPGFIDIHLHEDPVIDGRIYDDEKKSIFSSMLRMGVTTCLGGNCGDNVCNPGDYLDLVDRDGAYINIAMLAGHGFLRREAGAKDKYLRASASEKEKLYWMVEDALDRGCLGASFGIRYIPGTEREEVLNIAKLCKERGKLIASHIRDDARGVFDALDEFLLAAKEAGTKAQVSHIGSMAGFGQMEEFLKRIEDYREGGLDVYCDCYPYYAFSTSIGATTFDDGWMERYGVGYDSLEVCEGEYEGRRCNKEIFDELRDKHPDFLVVGHVMKKEDVDMAIRHPLVMIASDGLLSKGKGHPRAAGTFPRLLGEFVRDRKIELYEALRKITAMPKERLGLKSKGSIGIGDDADITIFNPDTIKDRADFRSSLLPPDGISYVLIAGEIALEDGKIKNGRLGKTIRK